MSEYVLGERVMFTRHLFRRTAEAQTVRGVRKFWSSEGWPGQPEPEEREGIVVGERTLANGVLWWGDWDNPSTFKPDEHFKAYLIAFDLRRKPVLVLPKHMRRKIELLLGKDCDSTEEHPPHKWPGKHWCQGVGIWG